MHHPFAGIDHDVLAGGTETSSRETRRSIVARLLGAIASVAGLAHASAASAQSPRKRPAVSCWSGRCAPSQPAPPPPPPPTAVGDSVDGFAATTQAVGEEGGQAPVLVSKPPKPPVSSSPQPTTRAAGEEGGGVSTQALLEEGADGRVRRPGMRRPPVSAPTTRASGEEGGGAVRQSRATPSTSEAAMLELLYGDLD